MLDQGRCKQDPAAHGSDAITPSVEWDLGSQLQLLGVPDVHRSNTNHGSMTVNERQAVIHSARLRANDCMVPYQNVSH